MFLLLGIVMSILGFGGGAFVARRKFYRRNVAGVEEFKSYGSMAGNGCLEMLIGTASGFLAFFGLIFLFFGLAGLFR